MYAGFILENNMSLRCSLKQRKEYIDIARENYNVFTDELKKEFLLNIELVENKILAKPIEDKWFPSVKSHIFLSHSHKDEDDVLVLAGYLKKSSILTFLSILVYGDIVMIY